MIYRTPSTPTALGANGQVALQPLWEKEEAPTVPRPMLTILWKKEPTRVTAMATVSQKVTQAMTAAVSTIDYSIWASLDNTFGSTVPSIVRCKKMYQTEAMERQNEALPAYKDVLAAQGLAAKLVPGQDHRSRHRVAYAPDYVNYAGEGFIRGQCSHLKVLLCLYIRGEC